MKNLKIIALVIIAILVAAGLFLGTIVKSGIQTVGSDIAGVPITVESVKINPITGTASLTDLIIGNPKGFKSDFAFALENVSIDLSIFSLLSDRIEIQSIRITNPVINYEIGARGTNINALASNLSSGSNENAAKNESTQQPSNKSQTKIIITDLYITDAQVKAGIGEAAASITLPKIHLSDIGKDSEGGTSLADATKLVMAAVTTQIAQADLSVVTDQLKNLGGAVEDTLKNAAEKFKGLF